jgi:hypothetical protein
MLREHLRLAMDFVIEEVMSDIARIGTDYVYSLRTVSVWHRTVDHGDHDIRYHILVTARTNGDCVVVSLERTDTEQSVSGMVDASGFSYIELLCIYDTLIDDLLIPQGIGL